VPGRDTHGSSLNLSVAVGSQRFRTQLSNFESGCLSQCVEQGMAHDDNAQPSRFGVRRAFDSVRIIWISPESDDGLFVLHEFNVPGGFRAGADPAERTQQPPLKVVCCAYSRDTLIGLPPVGQWGLESSWRAPMALVPYKAGQLHVEDAGCSVPTDPQAAYNYAVRLDAAWKTLYAKVLVLEQELTSRREGVARSYADPAPRPRRRSPARPHR
jgi:hypothetical protein